jgi:hypothetical protein
LKAERQSMFPRSESTPSFIVSDKMLDMKTRVR